MASAIASLGAFISSLPPESMIKLAELRDTTTGDGTQAVYASRLNSQLSKYGFSLDAAGILLRILHPDKIGQATLEGLLPAVNWHLQRTKAQSIPKDEYNYLKDLMARKSILDGTQPTPRGTIDYIHLGQLVLHAREFGTADDVWNIRLKYFSGVRTVEMTSLTFSKLRLNAGSRTFYVVLPKIHDPNARLRGFHLEEEHHFSVEFSTEIMHERFRRTGDVASVGSQQIARNWNPARLLGLIHGAAKRFNWAPGLLWDLHALRHGVATSVATSTPAAQVVTAVKKTTGHASATTIRRYTAPVSARVAKVDKNKAKTAAATTAARKRTAARK